MYVVECSFRTKDKLKTCNARTSIRLRKLWVSNHCWNSESLLTQLRPSRHVLAKVRRMSTVALDSLTSYRPWPRHFSKTRSPSATLC